MEQVMEYSRETKEILASDDASRKRTQLRARYREYLEMRTGKSMQEWFGLLGQYDGARSKSHYQLSKHLLTTYALEVSDANTIVSYYLNPDKRLELG